MSERAMRGLSVRQPWASLIAEGFKTIELRSWFTHFRGTLAIVAARDLDRPGVDRHGRRDAPKQKIVALAELVDVRRATPDDAKAAMVGEVRDGMFAWVLADVRAVVAPISFKGKQGLFNVPMSLFGAIR